MAALIAVLALLGWLFRVFSDNDERAQERIADETDTSETAPTLDAIPPALGVAAPTPEPDPTGCRTDPGDQKSPGVIAAFEHAYYVTRSGTAVRALTTTPPCRRKRRSRPESTPSQREPPTACASRPSPPGSTPSLTEIRTDQAPGQFSQTITTKDIDGRWFVDSIS
ncbi:hypothetical protein GCM10020255_011220 [Rhodococcus baikonurensis]